MGLLVPDGFWPRIVAAVLWIERHAKPGGGARGRGDRVHRPSAPWPPIMARITAHAASGNRWTYTFEQAYKSSAGYAGWTALSGGIAGVAYNDGEEPDPGATAYPAVPTGTIVELRAGPNYDTGDDVEYRFAWAAADRLPDGTADYQVLVWDNTAGEAAWGWPRMHG